MRTPTSLRAKVRRDYLAGEGTCRELAKKYGLPYTTVENWCRREGWRAQMTAIDGRLTAATQESLVERANTLVARRAAFIERTLAEGEALLDLVERERLKLRPGDLEALRKLVTCWRPVTEMVRKSLGLDEPQEQKTDVKLHFWLNDEEPRPVRKLEATECREVCALEDSKIAHEPTS